MKKPRSTTPRDKNTSRDIASYSKHLVGLINPGGLLDLLALPGSKRAQEIADERDRYWLNTIVRLEDYDVEKTRPVLYMAEKQLEEQMKLARWPRTWPRTLAKVKLEAICRSSKKADTARAPMARIALDGLAAYDSATRHVEKRQWKDALESAINLGRCIGLLEGKNENAAARRDKGEVKGWLLKAYQTWNDDPAKRKKHKKFDTEAAMDCCPELKETGAASLKNMISALKTEERRFKAFLQRCSDLKRQCGPLANMGEEFQGTFFSRKGFP